MEFLVNLEDAAQAQPAVHVVLFSQVFQLFSFSKPTTIIVCSNYYKFLRNVNAVKRQPSRKESNSATLLGIAKLRYRAEFFGTD